MSNYQTELRAMLDDWIKHPVYDDETKDKRAAALIALADEWLARGTDPVSICEALEAEVERLPEHIHVC